MHQPSRAAFFGIQSWLSGSAAQGFNMYDPLALVAAIPKLSHFFSFTFHGHPRVPRSPTLP